MGAIHDSTALAGYCYTQLTDTLQETNGLVGSDRARSCRWRKSARS